MGTTTLSGVSMCLPLIVGVQTGRSDDGEVDGSAQNIARWMMVVRRQSTSSAALPPDMSLWEDMTTVETANARTKYMSKHCGGGATKCGAEPRTTFL